MHYAELLKQIILSIFTGSAPMNVAFSADFGQLLAALAVVIGPFSVFLWWLLRQVAVASAAYTSTVQSLTDVRNDVDILQQVRDSNEITIKRIDDRLIALESRTMYRMEVLEIMKNLDRWCRQLTTEIQSIVGKDLKIDNTDFQTEIIKKQQQIDERTRS